MKTIMKQKTEQDTEQTAGAGTSHEKTEITEAMAKIKIEGQEFELESEFASDDKLLKTILQPHFSSIENANITRDVKNGRLTVQIVKKAQHKGV